MKYLMPVKWGLLASAVSCLASFSIYLVNKSSFIEDDYYFNEIILLFTCWYSSKKYKATGADFGFVSAWIFFSLLIVPAFFFIALFEFFMYQFIDQDLIILSQNNELESLAQDMQKDGSNLTEIERAQEDLVESGDWGLYYKPIMMSLLIFVSIPFAFLCALLPAFIFRRWGKQVAASGDNLSGEDASSEA